MRNIDIETKLLSQINKDYEENRNRSIGNLTIENERLLNKNRKYRLSLLKIDNLVRKLILNNDNEQAISIYKDIKDIINDC